MLEKGSCSHSRIIVTKTTLEMKIPTSKKHSSAVGCDGSDLGGASDSDSDNQLTKKEMLHLCRGGHKRLSSSESDVDNMDVVVSKHQASRPNPRKIRKQSMSTPPVNTPSSSFGIPKSAPQVSRPSRSSTKLPARNSELGKSVPRKSSDTSQITPSRPVNASTISHAVNKDKGHTQIEEDYLESRSFSILKDISSKLNSVAERVVRIESRLEAVEKGSTTSSSSDAKSKKKHGIPRALRVS